MKVCIIGSVVTKKHVGGVATFTEALAEAFALQGHETIILTNQAEKNRLGSRVKIVNLHCGKLLFFLKSIRYLKKHTKDLLVGSTWYDFSLVLSPGIKGKKIHYLHGFGVPKDGLWKAFFIALNDKLRNGRCMMIANSEFTRMINEVFFRTRVDAVVPIGISPSFRGVKAHENGKERTMDLLYVGRVRKNKGVDKMIRAAAVYEKKYGEKLKAAVVGDGPQLQEIKDLAKKLNVDVMFAGKLGQKETIAYYSRAKVFVSLDGKEPFGQTFAEAVACGCKVVCPVTGGQLEYLCDYPELFRCTTIYKDEKIADAVHGLLKASPVQRPERFYEKHSYEKVAERILDLAGERVKEY